MMDEQDDIPVETKRTILNSVIAAHLNGRYQSQVLLRVNKSIGSDTESIKALTDDLIAFEKKLDLLRAELKSLDKQPTPPAA